MSSIKLSKINANILISFICKRSSTNLPHYCNQLSQELTTLLVYTTELFALKVRPRFQEYRNVQKEVQHY